MISKGFSENRNHWIQSKFYQQRTYHSRNTEEQQPDVGKEFDHQSIFLWLRMWGRKNRETIETELKKVFDKSEIIVKEDLMAAAYAAYKGTLQLCVF